MMVDEVLDAVVVESDGIEHAGRGLDGARRRVAGPGVACHRLGDDAAQPGKVNDAGHLARIAEGARRDEDRVAKTQPAEGYTEIHGSRKKEKGKRKKEKGKAAHSFSFFLGTFALFRRLGHGDAQGKRKKEKGKRKKEKGKAAHSF